MELSFGASPLLETNPTKEADTEQPSRAKTAEVTSPFIDMRRYGIRHMMLMAFSFALALTCARYLPFPGRFAVLLVTLFWSGCAALTISDTIDSRPVEDRNLIAQAFNAIGAVSVGVSVALGIASVGTVLILGVIAVFRAGAQGT